MTSPVFFKSFSISGPFPDISIVTPLNSISLTWWWTFDSRILRTKRLHVPKGNVPNVIHFHSVVELDLHKRSRVGRNDVVYQDVFDLHRLNFGNGWRIGITGRIFADEIIRFVHSFTLRTFQRIRRLFYYARHSARRFGIVRNLPDYKRRNDYIFYLNRLFCL